MAKIQIEVQLYKNGKGKDKGQKTGKYTGNFDVSVINAQDLFAVQLPLDQGGVTFDNLPAGEYLVVLPTRDGGPTKNLVAVFDEPYDCTKAPASIKKLTLGENDAKTLEAGVWKIPNRPSRPTDPKPCASACQDPAFDHPATEESSKAAETEASEEDFKAIPCATCNSRYYTPGTPYYGNYPAWYQCEYTPKCT